MKEILEIKHISQIKLADMLGVSRQAIAQYFKAERLQDSTLDKILTAIEITTEDFFDTIQKVEEPQATYAIKKYSRPYYDVEVFATPGVELITDSGYIEPQGFITVPQFSNADFYIRVTGDSMYPKYRHGDIIPVKKVEHRSFFSFYEPYVIVTRTNKMRLLKYVHPHDDDDKILLVSYDSGKFKPQAIDKDEILALYHVLGKIEL